MAGIDTDRERSVFEYEGYIYRPIPPPQDPESLYILSKKTSSQIADSVLAERASILKDAIDTDKIIAEVLDIVNEQTKDLRIPITGDDMPGTGDDMPGLRAAIGRLGGTDEITREILDLARNILKNAAIAAMCVDPVHLVFAQPSSSGPSIPRVLTRMPADCKEAGDPNLFSPTRMDVDDRIGFDAAYDQMQQMSLYRTLLLTWYGIMMFVLRPILSMVERIIKALRRTWVLRPIANIFKKVARWLRKLICWSEKRIFGKPLSSFCKPGKLDEGLDDSDSENDTGGDRELCFDNSSIDDSAPSEDKDCIRDDSGNDPPKGEGCPAVIPVECTEAAQKIVDFANKWALENNDTSGSVNPAAILMRPAIDRVIDLQETGKFLLTSQDDSAYSDLLKKNTVSLPHARNRWMHPSVIGFEDRFKPARVSYTANDQLVDNEGLPVGRTKERCDVT